MSCEKFGKVFVLEDSDNTKSVSWKCIPFGSFSNSDLLWYGFDGEVHPDYSKYKGHLFAVGFTLNIALENNFCTFERKLDTGLFVGDDQNFLTDRPENILEFKPRNPTVAKLIEDIHLDAFGSFITGDNGLDKFPLLQYVLPCVLPREAGKKDAELLRKLDLNYDQLKKVTRYVSRPLQELHYAGSNDNDLKKESGNFNLMTLISPTKLFGLKMTDLNSLTSRLSLVTMLTKGVQEEILKLGDSRVDNNYNAFVETVIRTFENGCLENSKEFRNEMSSFPESISTTKELQIMNEGYQVILEAVSVATGIHFPFEKEKEIRNSFLFQKFLFHFCTQMGIINEIFSVALSSLSSLPSVVMKYEELKDTLKEYVKQANHNMKVFTALSSLLLNMNESEDDEIKKNLDMYVKLAKRIICGFLLWQAHRYREDNLSNFVFDCYVYNKK